MTVSPQIWLSLLFISAYLRMVGQNTVGLLAYQDSHFFPGYDLFYPENQSTVYLMNGCGQLVHSWPDSSIYRPGDVAYLLESGLLVKTKRHRNAVLDAIWAGGGGEFIEIRSWDNELLYHFQLNNTKYRLHHDVTILPNGNILAIAWEVKTAQQAIESGRRPELIYEDEVWPDFLLEIDPVIDSVVWEWHVWDHLIQDYDPAQQNFGTIADHPELIDVNLVLDEVRADWLHTNSIDYIESLDQILLSVPHFNEIWVIDHSTTTLEASSHSGGRSGKGGDLLIRWGNPSSFDRGGLADQLLFFQHDARFLPGEDLMSEGMVRISLFNNRVNSQYSTANILSVRFDTASWNYPLDSNGIWGPSAFEEIIFHPDTFSLLSESVSSFQLLPNNNRLVFAGRTGTAFELSEEGELVWEYKIPLKAGRPIAQGSILTKGDNFTFRYDRYPLDFLAFIDRDLTPKGYLELNPNPIFCDEVTSIHHMEGHTVKVYPNPFNHSLTIFSARVDLQSKVEVYDGIGRLFRTIDLTGDTVIDDCHSWSPGIYYIRMVETNEIFPVLKK